MIDVREVDVFHIDEKRHRWYTDQDIDRYIGFNGDLKVGDNQPINTEVERHFELHLDGEHVGDVRTKFNSEEDKQNKAAEFFIIVGVRNAGVGSKAFPKFIEYSKKYYSQLYCTVHKSNVRSAKLMKKVGFYVDAIKGNELVFRLDLDEF